MLICKKYSCVALTVALLTVGTSAGLAFDAAKIGSDDAMAGKSDAGPQLILRYGYNALKAGNRSEALKAFRHNADQNHLPSQWKLARMLQTGNGADSDQWAAYSLYQQIADRFAERAPSRAERPFVSSAVVELGKYSLTGIKGTNVRPDIHAAELYFSRAALLYGDANAQYHLGMLYLDENRGSVQAVRAARWLKRASRKGHALAQAELGDMLFHGRGVKQNRVLGLVYLTRASARNRARELRDLRRGAFAAASQAQRSAARKILKKLNIVAGEDVDAGPAPSSSVFGLNANATIDENQD